MAVNTVIFDFDGTLADTNRIVINSWQHTYREIWGKEEDEKKIIETFGEPLVISMMRIFPNHNIDKLVNIYRSYQVNHFKEMIEAFPGMTDLVKTLKSLDYNVGIVTSRTRESTLKGLEKFEITDCIDSIISCDDTDKHKPDPTPVNMALEYFESKPENAVMVGDSMFDIKCAHNAGVPAVLVKWAIAVTEKDMAGPDKPEYVIKEPKDLLEII